MKYSKLSYNQLYKLYKISPYMSYSTCIMGYNYIDKKSDIKRFMNTEKFDGECLNYTYNIKSWLFPNDKFWRSEKKTFLQKWFKI